MSEQEIKPITGKVTDTLESTSDYFSDQKQANIVSTSFETLDPLDIICYEEEAEEFELFYASETDYLSNP